MWHSQLDCVVLQEITQLKVTQEVGIIPDLPGPLILNPVFFFSRTVDYTVFCAYGPNPQALTSPEQARAIPVVPGHVRARHGLSSPGLPTAVHVSLAHLLGSWEPPVWASQIRCLSVALAECLLSTQPRPPHTAPRYMCEK